MRLERERYPREFGIVRGVGTALLGASDILDRDVAVRGGLLGPQSSGSLERDRRSHRRTGTDTGAADHSADRWSRLIVFGDHRADRFREECYPRWREFFVLFGAVAHGDRT